MVSAPMRGSRVSRASSENFLGREVIQVTKRKSRKQVVIAYRKACKANGTGLSHYILVSNKSK